MTTNTMTAAPIATLTEKELWALFVNNVMNASMGSGTVIERYKPDSHLRDPGAWGMIQDFSASLADDLEEADHAEEELSLRIEEIENYVVLLKIVLEDFHKAKSMLEIEGDDDAEPRYRNPFSGNAEAA
jgi:hypothetical protein